MDRPIIIRKLLDDKIEILAEEKHKVGDMVTIDENIYELIKKDNDVFICKRQESIMDHTKCIKCKSKTRIELGSLPGEGYQCGFWIDCTECGNTSILLIDEDKFDVEFKLLEDDIITFVLKGKIEKKLL